MHVWCRGYHVPWYLRDLPWTRGSEYNGPSIPAGCTSTLSHAKLSHATAQVSRAIVMGNDLLGAVIHSEMQSNASLIEANLA